MQTEVFQEMNQIEEFLMRLKKHKEFVSTVRGFDDEGISFGATVEWEKDQPMGYVQMKLLKDVINPKALHAYYLEELDKTIEKYEQKFKGFGYSDSKFTQAKSIFNTLLTLQEQYDSSKEKYNQRIHIESPWPHNRWGVEGKVYPSTSRKFRNLLKQEIKLLTKKFKDL